MAAVLQIGSETVTAEDILSRIKHYQLLPKLKRELIIDQAIATVHCTPDEIEQATQQLIAEYQLDSEEARQIFCQRRNLTSDDLTALLTRLIRIERFKHQTWGHKVPSYFLQRKRLLDKVVYSCIQLNDEEMARELYFRIHEKEQSFAELAQAYSQGFEAQIGGIVGPVELGAIHPELAKLLTSSQRGELCQPILIENWLFIIRLEILLPAQLDNSMHQRLLDELFEAWLQAQMDQSSLHQQN